MNDLEIGAHSTNDQNGRYFMLTVHCTNLGNKGSDRFIDRLIDHQFVHIHIAYHKVGGGRVLVDEHQICLHLNGCTLTKNKKTPFIIAQTE